MLYNGNIESVQFYLAGSEGAVNDAYVQVNTGDMYKNNLPQPEGICDAHMGTIAHEYRCQTCFNNHKNCLGHSGYIPLNYPVWNQNAVKDGPKWIRLICFVCGYPVIQSEDFMHFPKNKRLDEASKLAKTSQKICVHCKAIHPLIKKDHIEPLKYYAEYMIDKHLDRRDTLYPHIVKDIYDKIIDATVIALGKSVASHPKNFILYNIPVPSVIIRPDVKKLGSTKSSNDDITTSLQFIIKKSDAMPQIIPPVIDEKMGKAIFEINNAYYDMAKATSDGSMNSIAKRIKGKPGLPRKNLLGKRCRNMARSTIIGNIGIKIDEVGVPLTFARTNQYEEIVQEHNKKQLLEYIQNGRDKYPGCTQVIKQKTGKSYYPSAIADIGLEIGDIVYRDMITGDVTNYNRQPSLKISNISTHRVVVITNPNIRTLVMNVIACVLYGADFDGDCMHLIINASMDARNEIAELSSVQNWFISHTSGSPQMGQVEDSVIGTAELTRSGVMLNKYAACLLFKNTSIVPSHGDNTSGRDCLSKLLEATPINLIRSPEWYKPNMTPYIHYDPTEIKVRIEKGKILSGILDKKTIGKNVNGGLYHIIANDFGAKKSLEVMYNMQQMAVAHVETIGYTMGIMDLMIPQSAKDEINRISSDIINKSHLITERLHGGNIIPPIGKSVEEFYEELQIDTLRIFDDFTEPILQAINPNTNNLFKLIAFGSKGKMNDMFNMMSSIGQKLINGERIRQKFGYKRSLVYFPRFDSTPESRGYITNSYFNGMKTTEYIFNAMAARFDLITKALSTSITGEQNRKSIKNLESTITNNYRWSIKNLNVVQFAYGDDFLDPRYVEKVKFPTIMCSDDDLVANYYHKDFPEEFEAIKNDRKEFRLVYTRLELSNIRDLMTDVLNVPVSIDRVIIDVLREYSPTESPSVADVKEMMKTIRDLCENIPYILINEVQERKKSAIPKHIRIATWLLQILIRSYLHPRALIEKSITGQYLQIIVDKIRFKYMQALVAPGTAVGVISAQSFSEPLTQYMLDAHHRSTSGGTSKSGIMDVKEILGARSVKNLKHPTMLIPLIDEVSGNKTRVQEIASNIEMMKLEKFITSWHIFFEKYGEPVHSKTIHEVAMFEEFAKNNPLLSPPKDLTKWVIRFVLDKTSLILKNMPIELIINKLREGFPDVYIIYTPENAATLIIRVYMRMTMFKGPITPNEVIGIKNQLLTMIIRGVNGIVSASAIKMIRNKVNPDGSISINDNLWGITTVGTNLRGIFANKYVDVHHVQTDAIQEVMRVLGIEAARRAIITGMSNLAISDINSRHYMLYADEMTVTGRVTSIESAGLRTRENSNILLRIGASSPMATLEEAALNNMVDSVSGVTGPLLLGSVPKVGSIYNSFQVNREFVKENVKRPDDILDALL